MYTYATFNEVDYDLVRKCITDGIEPAKATLEYRRGALTNEKALDHWIKLVGLSSRYPSSLFTVGYYNGDPIAFTTARIRGTLFEAEIGFWANIDGSRSYVTRVEWWHTFTDWLKEQGYTELQMPVFDNSDALRCYEIIATKIKYEAEIDPELNEDEQIKTFRVYLGE